MTQISIDIISDTVCPWCFVGKRRLEKAIASHQKSHPDTKFTIAWHPFYLDPTAGKAEDKMARYERKFGKPRMAQMIPYMKQIGDSVGIKFEYGGKTGNTRDSHRLIEEAGQKGLDVQDKLVNALFHSYFEVNEDITSQDVLARIAAEVGLFSSKEEALEFLKSEKRGPEVDKEVDFNQYRRGISGVPHFIIEGSNSGKQGTDNLGEIEVGGAQDPKVFENIFSQLEKYHKDEPKIEGDVCLPDGSNC
jgi:predicted DsbA family dithiol-disulfide isomerase